MLSGDHHSVVAGFGRGAESFMGLISVEQLSLLMHKSPASIRSDASRNPSTLPPICRIPGCKRLLWRPEDVLTFFASCVQLAPIPSPPSLASNQPKRRGRPRKVEVRA